MAIIKGTYDTVKQVFQDFIAPDLERIKGQLTGIDARVGALEKRVEDGLSAARAEVKAVDVRVASLRNVMLAGFRSVDDRFDALKERVEQTNRRLDDTNRRLDEALDIRERLAARG